MTITEKQEHSKEFLKKRSQLLVFPVLIVPFLTLLFWSMGGGGDSLKASPLSSKGLNTELPGAENIGDSTLDKLAYYEKADKDSIILANKIKGDPYYQQNQNLTEANTSTGNGAQTKSLETTSQGKLNTNVYSGYAYNDPNEKRVTDKLKELNDALNAPDKKEKAADDKVPGSQSVPGVNSTDIDRLEKMMNTMQTGGATDPEMQQINGMLNQILDIQHPELVQERLRKASAANQGSVYAVSSVSQNDPVSLLDSNRRITTLPLISNGFYSLNEDQATASQNTIAAVIHETQTLVDGAIVKLRLLDDIFINGQLIPKDNFVFGIAGLSGERLNISIKSLRFKNSIFPVQLSVYDLDGLNGIYIPGAIGRDVAKSSGDQAIQGLGISSLDPSITAQAMGAGIEAAKSLMSKKIKLIKVSVKAGYQVFLKDDTQKQAQ